MAIETPKPTKAPPAGREPIKNKRYEVLKELDYTEQSRLSITEKQKSYLDSNNLSHRFIYEKDYLKNNNFHARGWTVVADPDMPGANSDGIVKVGDLVMAVKTKDQHAKYKRALAAKNFKNSDMAAVNKAAADELKKAMGDARVTGQIHAGYEENGDGSGDEE